MVLVRPGQRSLAAHGRGWALQAAAWLALGLLGARGAAWAQTGSAYVSSAQLASFVPRTQGARAAAFGSANADELCRQRQGVRPREAAVLYATWENPWAGAGGLLAVA